MIDMQDYGYYAGDNLIPAVGDFVRKFVAKTMGEIPIPKTRSGIR